MHLGQCNGVTLKDNTSNKNSIALMLSSQNNFEFKNR